MTKIYFITRASGVGKTTLIVCNVNGVPAQYFNVKNEPALQNKAYFIGKLMWLKGFKELIDLCHEADFYEMDIYGNGKEEQEIIAYRNSQGLSFKFLGVLPSPETVLGEYKIFINPSISEVMCTTTLEALAMRKFVIIPKHVSNEFFYSFSNCLTYENSVDFKAVLCSNLLDWSLDKSRSDTSPWA